MVSKDNNPKLFIKNSLYDTDLREEGGYAFVAPGAWQCPKASYVAGDSNIAKTSFDFNFEPNNKVLKDIAQYTDSDENRESTIKISLDTTRTLTEADYQRLGNLLDGIEGLQF